jgi:ElaB/YqjD/DUF883 family membrane-anchored ribosome-binding protein
MTSTADRIDAESQKDPARLEREIDQQREDINHIVDALENKLSPGQMFDRLVNFGKGNGREVAQNIANAVKANPIPALLTTVGLVWLYASRNDPAPSPMLGRGTLAGTHPGVGAGASLGARDGQGVMDRARELGEDVSDSVSSTWNQARSRVSDAASRLADTAQGARTTLQQQTDRAVQGYNHLLRDNPLALGAIGIAIGALLGAALPTTEPENRLMGEASDNLADKARDVVQTGADKARETLHDMGEPQGNVRH